MDREYRPQLAALVKAPPLGDEWLHEIKLDGYRIGCRIRNGRATLISRNGKDWTQTFPEIVEATERLGVRDALIDGEVAMVLPDGRTSFQALQNASIRARGSSLVYFVFDLLRLEGADLRDLPLRERKRRLRDALRFEDPIRFTPHRNEHGEKLFEEACRKGLEGVIAKRADSPYRATRSRDWLKLKCHAEQELVIGGFTAPQGSRTDFGALLVGHFDSGTLRYAGKVGTGFGRSTLAELGAQLRKLESKDNPFADVHPIPRGTHWVKPKLVAQIGFTEWTRDGRLRHPRYLGLRDDKPAREVVRERPS